MKIITALLLSLLILSFSSCSQPQDSNGDISQNASATIESDDSAADTETDYAEIATSLFEEGRRVFKWYHIIVSEDLNPDYDEDSLVDEYFMPIGKFQTMQELKSASEAIFTLSFCNAHFYDKIEDLELFKEIDGALYINGNVGGIGWVYSLPDAFSVQSITEDQVVLTAFCDGLPLDDDEQATRYQFPCTLVNDNGTWKLGDYYQYTPEGYDDERVTVKDDTDDA